MSAEVNLLVFLICIVLWMDVKATMPILRDSLSEPVQQTIQLATVRLLPVLGAIIVFAVHRPAEKHPGTRRPRGKLLR